MPISLIAPLGKQKGLRILLTLGLLALGACHKDKVNEEVPKLQAQLEASQKRLGDLDLELKTSQGDPATTQVLLEDKELLKSRIERLKEKLIALGALAPAGSGGGGGHH